MTTEERVAEALQALPDDLKTEFCAATGLPVCNIDFLDTPDARERARDWVEDKLNVDDEPSAEVLDLRRELRQWRNALGEVRGGADSESG